MRSTKHQNRKRSRAMLPQRGQVANSQCWGPSKAVPVQRQMLHHADALARPVATSQGEGAVSTHVVATTSAGSAGGRSRPGSRRRTASMYRWPRMRPGGYRRMLPGPGIWAERPMDDHGEWSYHHSEEEGRVRSAATWRRRPVLGYLVRAVIVLGPLAFSVGLRPARRRAAASSVHGGPGAGDLVDRGHVGLDRGPPARRSPRPAAAAALPAPASGPRLPGRGPPSVRGRAAAVRPGKGGDAEDPAPRWPPRCAS